MENEKTFTYQTRLKLSESEEKILEDYASLFSLVEHSLLAEVAKGKSSASCKTHYLEKFAITARQFNACRISLEGKIASYEESRKQGIASLKGQINAAEKKIQSLEKKPSKKFVLHHKKRRKAILSKRLSVLEEDQKKGRIHLCFGGKKLFCAQFHLEENGFSSHEEWKKCWQAKRSNEFFTLGSKDETAGNQTCTAKVKDGYLVLRLRLPPALEKTHGKYLEISNVTFGYGLEAFLKNLNHPDGKAISYRFKKDEKGWRVFASTTLERKEPISKEGIGAIGIDLNADHIACVETDRFGNPIAKKSLPWICYGKNRNQLKAATGDLCKTIVKYAIETKKPIVIEDLDFQKRKLSLYENGHGKLSRLLSSFAYGLFFTFLMARAYKYGVIIHQVNPAFTSIIGRVNYAKRYGLTTHLAAALCIARRQQKFSEAPCSSKGVISDGKGSHVAFVLPARNRTKHVWVLWGQVKKKIKTVLAAHFRAIHHRSLSPSNSTLETGRSRLLLV
jgi:IS605 OrfB family transposase